MPSAVVLNFPCMENDRPDPALPNRIRFWRVKRKLTLKGLAGTLGMSHGHLANLERGLRELNVATMERIAKALGVSAADLLRESDGGLSERERLIVETYREVPEAMRRSLDAVAESQQPFRGSDEVRPLRPDTVANDGTADSNGSSPRKRA